MANVIVFGAALNYVLFFGLEGRPVEAKHPEGRTPSSRRRLR